MPAAKNVFCPTCRRGFTARGHGLHIQNTTDPRCIHLKDQPQYDRSRPRVSTHVQSSQAQAGPSLDPLQPPVPPSPPSPPPPPPPPTQSATQPESTAAPYSHRVTVEDISDEDNELQSSNFHDNRSGHATIGASFPSVSNAPPPVHTQPEPQVSSSHFHQTSGQDAPEVKDEGRDSQVPLDEFEQELPGLREGPNTLPMDNDEPVPFEGDFFGSAADYRFEDFPGLDRVVEDPSERKSSRASTSARSPQGSDRHASWHAQHRHPRRASLGPQHISPQHSAASSRKHRPQELGGDPSEPDSSSDLTDASHSSLSSIDIGDEATSTESEFDDDTSSWTEESISSEDSFMDSDSESDDEEYLSVSDMEDSDDEEDSPPAPQPARRLRPAPTSGREYIEQRLRQEIHAIPYKSALGFEGAGQPLPNVRGPTAHEVYAAQLNETLPEDAGFYSPWSSQLENDIVDWAKQHNITGSALDHFLKIKTVRDKLNLSFKTTSEMNNRIDSLPDTRPAFTRTEIKLDNVTYDVYSRNILACIQALIGNPDFAELLVFLPEEHYIKGKDSKPQRVFHDMHTGTWWPAAQAAVEEATKDPHATILPVVIASDKTQVTLFGNKAVYPVYMTLGQLPKEIRRKPSRQGWILLGYIPATSPTHIEGKTARRRATANLVHAALRIMVEPLIEAGRSGINVTTGAGDIQ